MRSYGHSHSAHSGEPASSIALQNIVLEVDGAFLEARRDFAQYALDHLRRLGDAYEHVHFRGTCEGWRDDWSDIVLIKRPCGAAPTEGT